MYICYSNRHHIFMMIDKNLLRVSLSGELQWVNREDLERHVNALHPITHSIESTDTHIVDGMRAVVAAGCNRRRLMELLVASDCLYIPPPSINPPNAITILHGDTTTMDKFIKDDTKVVPIETPLSVTQLWWMRHQHQAISSILINHGCAMQFDNKHMTVWASSPQLLRLCHHRLLQLLIDFVDCKIRHPQCDEVCDRVLQAAHSRGCFAVWHDGVLEVQGGRADVLHIVRSAPLVSTASPCKLINVHPHADKDFICGKKDGKLLRIMREMAVTIDLRDVTGDQLLQITTTGPCFDKAWTASRQVDDELPTVKIAHIPELHHRRLIGQQGKNIQRIMKRHAVYVKFYGDDEAEDEFGGSAEWHLPAPLFAISNVVIKTPSKNGEACQRSFEDILLECGFAEPPGMVRSVVVIDMADVGKIRLSGDQVIAFVDGQWCVQCFGTDTIVHYHHSDDVNTIDTIGEQENDGKVDIFTLFPSAFSQPTADPENYDGVVSAVHLEDQVIYAPPSPDTTTKVGVIGDTHTKPAMSRDPVDDEIEVLMRNLRQANLGRRKSVSVFQL